MDNIIKTTFYLSHKKIFYEDKIIEDYYFSKYLIIYKFYDYKKTVLREKTIVSKNNEIVHSKIEYDINGNINKN